MNLKNKLMRTVVLASVCMAASAGAQAVPQQLSFTANLTNSAGAPATGNHAFVFTLYDAVTNGNVAWTETQAVVPVNNGLVFTRLGLTTPLTATVFNGAPLWLEVSVDGTALSPRAPVASVPYAIRAGVANAAESIGSLLASEVQKRIVGSCSGANALQSIDADGGVGCVSIAGATGDVTAINTASTSGLAGGATSGDVNLSLASCPASQILKSTGTGWSCQADNAGTGTVTSIIAGSALTGGTISSTGTIGLMSCTTGQILQANSSGWACAAAPTEVHLGDVVSVSAAANGGLTVGGSATTPTIGLPSGCAAGSVMRWTGATWACQAESFVGTVTAVGSGAGLIGGPITSSGTLALDVDSTQFTFVSNKLTINNLPSTDNGYIRNQIASAQGAGFNVGGNGTVGGVVRAGSFGYTATQTGYFGIGARSFLRDPSSVGFSWLWMGSSNYAYIQGATCSNSTRCVQRLSSPAHLPANATVTLLECTVHDQSATTSIRLAASLNRNFPSSFSRSAVGSMGPVFSSGTDGSNGTQTFNSGTLAYVVDGASSYEVDVTYESDFPNDNAQMVFMGCRVTYTYSTIER